MTNYGYGFLEDRSKGMFYSNEHSERPAKPICNANKKHQTCKHRMRMKSTCLWTETMHPFMIKVPSIVVACGLSMDRVDRLHHSRLCHITGHKHMRRPMFCSFSCQVWSYWSDNRSITPSSISQARSSWICNSSGKILLRLWKHQTWRTSRTSASQQPHQSFLWWSTTSGPFRSIICLVKQENMISCLALLQEYGCSYIIDEFLFHWLKPHILLWLLWSISSSPRVEMHNSEVSSVVKDVLGAHAVINVKQLCIYKRVKLFSHLHLPSNSSEASANCSNGSRSACTSV